MKYSISNIAWDKNDDAKMYRFLQENNIDGIEIAPTRLFQNPYENLEMAKLYSQMLKNRYNLSISSMQSIWFGKTGNIFNKEDREDLFLYTKKAILFADSMGIKNIVFGNPKNRNIPQGHTINEVKDFFYKLGEFAKEKNTTLSLEANPAIYNTNFLNFTKDTCEFVKEINSEGLKVNIDFGTILENDENPHLIKTYKTIVNHIHLSVPYLEYVKKIENHKTLKKVFDKMDYQNYLSIEMKNQNDIEKVKKSVLYMKETF